MFHLEIEYTLIEELEIRILICQHNYKFRNCTYLLQENEGLQSVVREVLMLIAFECPVSQYRAKQAVKYLQTIACPTCDIGGIFPDPPLLVPVINDHRHLAFAFLTANV